MSDPHLAHAQLFSCVVTSDNRLLLTMRGHAKATWHGLWANSLNGHPTLDEPLPDIVSRAPRHEWDSWPGPELVLRVVTDEVPTPDPVEVGDFEWVSWPEFVDAVATGDITVAPLCHPRVAELTALGANPARWPVTHDDFSTAA